MPEGPVSNTAPVGPFAGRSAWALGLFRAYLHLLFRRRFSAVRIARTGVPDAHNGRPLVIYTNHPSWWDPALFMLVAPKLFPARIGFAPMDAAQLQRYAMFRRFGAFGVEAGPRGAATFLRMGRAGLAERRAMMWITAEGAFRDARQRPVQLRRGLAHLVRHAPNAVILPAALEYVFWNESRPEALLRFGAPVLARGSVDDIAQALTAALTETMDALATAAAARDPALFTTLHNGSAGTGLIYDSWQRVRAWLQGRRFSPRHEIPPP